MAGESGTDGRVRFRPRLSGGPLDGQALPLQTGTPPRAYVFGGPELSDWTGLDAKVKSAPVYGEAYNLSSVSERNEVIYLHVSGGRA
jgi:hypothetical protein